MSDSPTKKVEEGVSAEVVLQEAPAAVLSEGSLDPVYEAKARVLNKAIQDIGMGKYQWQVSCCLLSCARYQSSISLSFGLTIHEAKRSVPSYYSAMQFSSIVVF